MLSVISEFHDSGRALMHLFLFPLFGCLCKCRTYLFAIPTMRAVETPGWRWGRWGRWGSGWPGPQGEYLHQVVVSGGSVWTAWFHMLPRFQGSRKAVFDKAIAAMKARQKAGAKKFKWHSSAKRIWPSSVFDISLIHIDWSFDLFCLQKRTVYAWMISSFELCFGS